MKRALNGNNNEGKCGRTQRELEDGNKKEVVGNQEKLKGHEGKCRKLT